jgi:mannose-1-phosphate guanylyltransferase/mannose-1-phosphate guanylyltransferase/mannose-6-phosphate isomerase
MQITPVILSGGGGTRLWPLSTPEKPKQFLALTGEQTMFQLTLERVQDRAMFAAPIIVSGAAHAALVETQSDVHDAILLLEPCARNTAPAIALAALAAADPKAVMLVMPSDHAIADVAAFHAATQAALPLVEAGWMVTYGITPTAPETGYGYIRMGAELENGVRQVERFVEKPDRETAEAMLAEGSHSWNGGIFLFRADIYLGALSVHAPEILAAAQKAMAGASRHANRIAPQAEAFTTCPADSIDYAVMEKAERVAVVPVSMGWSDVGSWDALYELSAKDAQGNAATGTTRLDSGSGNLIHAEGIRVSLHGVNDVIIVANGKEVMILPRGSSQMVRDFAGD